MKPEAPDSDVGVCGHQKRHIGFNPLAIHLYAVGRAQVDDLDVLALETHHRVRQGYERSLQRELVEGIPAHPDGRTFKDMLGGRTRLKVLDENRQR